MGRSNYQGYNCFSIYHAFAWNGRTSDTPKPGCLVIFKHSHIGRVTGIRNGRIYTNEGNTSALYGDSSGGTVKSKDYAVSDSNIQGYCLIDYGTSYQGNIDAVFGDSMGTAIRRFQKAQGLDADGIIGKETWSRLLK